MTRGWDFLCTLYPKPAPHLRSLNTYLDADIATHYIGQNEELWVLYSSTLDILRYPRSSYLPMYLFIDTFRIWSLWLLSVPSIIPKRLPLLMFLSTHGHHIIYKTNTITTITEYIDYWNSQVILNLYVQYSHPYLISVIAGIHSAPI